MRSIGSFILVLVLAVAASGCIPTRQARVAAVALTVQDVAKAAAKQSDTSTVSSGYPAYLMLLDGLLESMPDNRQLLIATSQAYSTYASSFIPDEDRTRSKALYAKAKACGFKALSTRFDFAAAAAGDPAEFSNLLLRFDRKDVPDLFWTATAWASWISSSSDSVEAMGDLPALQALMKRIIELDESFNYGGPHLLAGVYLAAIPAVMGGSLSRSAEHFQRAMALGADKLLSAKVLYAQYYARAAGDRNLFETTLRQVLDARADTVPELTLANTLAKEKARRLLDKTEEFFEPIP